MSDKKIESKKPVQQKTITGAMTFKKYGEEKTEIKRFSVVLTNKGKRPIKIKQNAHQGLIVLQPYKTMKLPIDEAKALMEKEKDVVEYVKEQ